MRDMSIALRARTGHHCFVLRPAAGNGPPEPTAPYLRRELR